MAGLTIKVVSEVAAKSPDVNELSKDKRGTLGSMKSVSDAPLSYLLSEKLTRSFFFFL